MQHSKSRQLVLSIAIITLMLSTSMVSQSVGATSAGGLIQASSTMTAGADGRWFGVVNETISYPAIEKIEYNNPFEMFFIDYTHDYLQLPVNPPGPIVQLVTPAVSGTVDPKLYSTGPLSTNLRVPNFIMTHNTTNDVVSPIVTLTVKDNITLGFGVTTEFQVDTTNVVVVTLGVSSAEQNKILALTGLVLGAGVSGYLYDPSGNLLNDLFLDVGYFAYPFLGNMQGYYVIYFMSESSSYVKTTPIVVPTTSMTVGQFASGEMSIPEEITYETLPSLEPEPSEIVALSYDVSAGSEYAFAFSMLELLSGDSYYTCFYYDVGTRWDGTPRWDTLAQTPETTVEPLVSRAAVSGKVYIVLVGNFMSKFQYAFGVESATVSTAPLNQLFPVQLPTVPFGMHRQLYKFSIPSESIVRMNYTSYSGTIYSQILEPTPSGTVYSTGSVSLSSGNSWIRSGLAESNYYYSLYMNAGDYLLALSAPSSGSVILQINAYQIESYTIGDAFNVKVHTTKALAVNIPTEFDFAAFNVTLLSQLNASMTYRLSMFDDYNRLISYFSADGSASSNQGIGNKRSGGSWQGTSGSFYTDPSGSGTKNFGGNKSLQVCMYVPTYAGRYFLIVDFLNGYNTTATGGSDLDRWTFYKDLTVSLKIEPSKPALGALANVKTLTLDSTSGTGTVSTEITGPGGFVALKLTPEVNAWTGIDVSIVNGTGIMFPAILIDRIRYFGTGEPILPFDYEENLGLWPTYLEITNKWGDHNTTYHIEFGTITPTMMILFPVATAGALHTIATYSVRHYDTQVSSGLTIPGGAPPVSAAPFPVEILLIAGVAAIVVVAVVVVYIVMKKRK